MGKWTWTFWKSEEWGEDEIIIYSPGSYASGEDLYYVVVLFRKENRDWWVCKFVAPTDPDRDVDYLRVENYGAKLRDAMTTCYSLNKIIGAV